MPSNKYYKAFSYIHYEKLEQDIDRLNRAKSSAESKEESEAKIIADTQKYLEELRTDIYENQTKEDIRKSARKLKKATKDYVKDGDLDKSKNKDFINDSIKIYLDDININWKPILEEDRLALFVWDINLSGSIEHMVDKSQYERKDKFWANVLGKYKKWALGKETARRDSGVVGGDALAIIVKNVFNKTPEDKKPEIYTNLRNAFARYSSLESKSITSAKDFIKQFTVDESDANLYMKFRDFLNHFGLQLQDMIAVGVDKAIEQTSKDLEDTNNIMKKAEWQAKEDLKENWTQIREDAKKWLDKSLQDLDKERFDTQQKIDSLTDTQKQYLLYLDGKNTNFDPSSISFDDKKAVEDLKSQRDVLLQKRMVVNKVKTDPKVFDQWVTQELTMGILMFSTMRDGKLVTFNNLQWEPQGKVRPQAVSLWYGVNYKLWENGRSFRTWTNVWFTPLDKIVTPSLYAWVWKTFEVGKNQFLSLWLLVSGWINSGSWWAWAWLGIWWSHQLNNKKIEKDLTAYTAKSLNRWVWAYMDLSKAISYGATLWLKGDKEAGILQKMPIIEEGFSSIFDELLKDYDTSKSPEENKSSIREKMLSKYEKTKDKWKSKKQIDSFVDQVYSIASVMWNTLTTTKENNRDFSRKTISAQLAHMYANARATDNQKALSKISIDGFNVNVAAIALWFVNPVMWLAAVTPSVKFRSWIYYDEDEQTRGWAEEDKNKLIGAYEKTDIRMVEDINNSLQLKDKITIDGDTISIPEEVYKNTPISVNTNYKSLLTNHTKIENGRWLVPSWIGMTLHEENASYGRSNKTLMLFANKNEWNQSFETITPEQITKFTTGDPTAEIPSELTYYTDESIKKAFKEFDEKVTALDLSAYFDISYKEEKIVLTNKETQEVSRVEIADKSKVDPVTWKPTISIFEPKGTIVFEKTINNGKESVTINQLNDKDKPLSFAFEDKTIDNKAIAFEKPKLAEWYTSFLKTFDSTWEGWEYFDYAKIRDLKYVKAKKGEYSMYGIKVDGVVKTGTVNKKGRPILNWDNARLAWKDSFKQFSLYLSNWNYKKAAEFANKVLEESGKEYRFDEGQRNELHDFNIKLTWERAAETISENSIKYKRDPKAIIQWRTDRFEKKWQTATGVPTEIVKSFRENINLQKDVSTTVNEFGWVWVVLWYEDHNNFMTWDTTTNSKYIVNPRYVWEKSEITDPLSKKPALENLLKNPYMKDAVMNALYTKLNIPLPMRNEELTKKIYESITNSTDLEVNWSIYKLDPKLYFAFYPDCVNESLLVDIEVSAPEQKHIPWKESMIDRNYENNALITNRSWNARAYVKPMIWWALLKEPISTTKPDVIESNTEPDVTDIQYETINNVKTSTIQYADGKTLILWDTQDGSPLSWNYWYYDTNGDFITISQGTAADFSNITNLPTFVQQDILDPTKVVITPPSVPTSPTNPIPGGLWQSILLWDLTHLNTFKQEFVKTAKKNAEEHKKNNAKKEEKSDKNIQ